MFSFFSVNEKWKYAGANISQIITFIFASVHREKGGNRGRVAIISALSRGVSCMAFCCMPKTWERLIQVAYKLKLGESVTALAYLCNVFCCQSQKVLLSMTAVGFPRTWARVPPGHAGPCARCTPNCAEPNQSDTWCAHCAAELEHRLDRAQSTNIN
jgi:hypothetical protein